MKQMKEHRLYGLVLFLVILFVDVGNIFTRIGKRIGFYEFIVIMLVVVVMAGIYLRLDVSIKMPIHSEIDTWVWDGLSALALYGLFLGLAVALHEPVFAWYKIIGTVIGIIACALLLEYRKRLLEKRRKQQADSDVQTNTYTLKDLYEGKVQGKRHRWRLWWTSTAVLPAWSAWRIFWKKLWGIFRMSMMKKRQRCIV